jgi:hypothetical protein
MLKKFVVLFACLGLVFQLSGCTSKDSKDDGEAMAVDAATADSAEVEKVEGGENLDITADDSAGSLSSDALPEDALGEAPTATAADPMATADSKSAPAGDVGSVDSPPIADLPADTLGQSSLPADSVVESTPPVVESAPMKESSASSSASSEEPKKEVKPVASYRKVEATPWKEGGKTLNTVYVSRDGDSWGSVSQMIYGSEKASELKKMNPAIKSRKLKPGDKVYYNSPHRPDDEAKVLTYYEDNGMAPEVYIAKSGDNLKGVAKELFGTDQAWKELYATNDFESKSNLDEGTQIRYWKSAPKPAATAVASATTNPGSEMAPPPAPGAEMAPPPPTNAAAGEMPPPPPSPNGDMAPPPPPPDMAMNEVAPPPPPPAVEAAPPPPPPPPAMVPPAPPQKAAHAEAASGNPLDDDQTQMLAAGAIVFVGLALFIMLRRRRRRELEQAIQDTQVG